MITEDGLFKLEQLYSLPYEKKDNVWVSITIERSLAVLEVARTVYTGFDFLSDVGGLSGILVSSLVLFVGAWNHNAFDNFMSANLFRVMKPPPTWFGNRAMKKNPDTELIGKERIELKARPNCLDLIKSLLPKKLQCCR